MSGHTIANYSKNVIYIIIVPWTHTLMRKLCISNFKRHWSICSLGVLEVQFHLDEPESQCLSLARGIPGTRILSAIKWKMVQEYIQNRPQFYQELKREIPFILMESSALDFNISNVSSTKVQSEHLRLGSHTNVFFVCRIILCCCPFLLFLATGRQRVRKEALSWLFLEGFLQSAEMQSVTLPVLFQVRKLEADILPLQESNAELSEKSGMLQAEKKLLEEDVKRWKARTQVGKCFLSRNIMWKKWPIMFSQTTK